ncbi:hypothetical protein J8273_4961 [Carpediemonas membranifera]|uniref:Uncharacterized protein n=1 Tax=Carpediemonas membranifera TaxID=201153 RepID=A0A8J6E9K9_9EUKA|nr:hypothetical protein J8273_4961 [Carpediemonas membranifera]|eukprot:KAG9393490.1 hypothetical protein J8273_4961 [Carpediemonas membranifera]
MDSESSGPFVTFVTELLEHSIENFNEERSYAPIYPSTMEEEPLIPSVLPWNDSCHLKSAETLLPPPPTVEPEVDGDDMRTAVPNTNDAPLLWTVSSPSCHQRSCPDRSTAIEVYLTSSESLMLLCHRPTRFSSMFPTVIIPVSVDSVTTLAHKIAEVDSAKSFADAVAAVVKTGGSDLLTMYTVLCSTTNSGNTIFIDLASKISAPSYLTAAFHPGPSPAEALLLTHLFCHLELMPAWLDQAVQEDNVTLLQTVIHAILFFHPTVVSLCTCDGTDIPLSVSHPAADCPRLLLIDEQEADSFEDYPSIMRTAVIQYFAHVLSIAEKTLYHSSISEAAATKAATRLAETMSTKLRIMELLALASSPGDFPVMLACIASAEAICHAPDSVLGVENSYLVIRTLHLLTDEESGDPDLVDACCRCIVSAVIGSSADTLSNLISAVGPDSFVEELYQSKEETPTPAQLLLLQLLTMKLPELRTVSWKSAVGGNPIFETVGRAVQRGMELLVDTTGQGIRRGLLALKVAEFIASAAHILLAAHMIRAIAVTQERTPKASPLDTAAYDRVARLRESTRSRSPSLVRSSTRNISPARSASLRRLKQSPTSSNGAINGSGVTVASSPLATPTGPVAARQTGLSHVQSVERLKQAPDPMSTPRVVAQSVKSPVNTFKDSIGGGYVIISPDLVISVLQRATVSDLVSTPLLKALDSFLRTPSVFARVRGDPRFFSALVSLLGSPISTASNSCAWDLLYAIIERYAFVADPVLDVSDDLISRVISQVSQANGTAVVIHGITFITRVLDVGDNISPEEAGYRIAANSALAKYLASSAGWARLHMICKRAAAANGQINAMLRTLLEVVTSQPHCAVLKSFLMTSDEYRAGVRPFLLPL